MTRATRLLARLVWLITAAAPLQAQAPRGDGAQTGDGSTPFTGLAQAPEANLFVGAATTSISIQVPPGRKSITPKLALVYNSNAGPSPYGYGWDLPLGKVQRSTKHGVLSCSDPEYREDFVLVLPDASVECTRDSGTNLCRARVEESFLRVEYVPVENYWQVWDKSGLKYTFGDSPATRLGSDVNALFVPGTGCSYTFSWALTRVEDPNKNTLEITYMKEEGILYPQQIRYGGNDKAGLAHALAVNFVWSDEDSEWGWDERGAPLPPRAPGDTIVNNMGGFTAKLTKLLSRIQVKYPVGGDPLRWYSLKYAFQINDEEVRNRSGRQGFLMAVTLYDRDGHALPRADGQPASTIFLYHHNAPPSGRFGFDGEAQSASRPSSGAPVDALRYTENGDTYRDVLDMDGDGIADFVSNNCYTLPDGTMMREIFRGRREGDGFESTPTQWIMGDVTVPGPWGQMGWGCIVRREAAEDQDRRITIDTLDLDGDGIVDLVDARNTPWVVYFGRSPATGAGWGFSLIPTSWPAPREWLRHSRTGSQGTVDYQDLIDMNGDGLLDVVRTEYQAGNWNVWRNTGTGFEAQGTPFPVAAFQLRLTRSTGQLIRGLIDINGDGLPDQIIVDSSKPDEWSVYLNTGHRMAESAETWKVPSSDCSYWGIRDTHGTNGSKVFRDFIDISGDGLPDLVDTCQWETTGFWQVALNRGAGFGADGTSDPPVYPWWSPSQYIREREPEAWGSGWFNSATTKRDTFDIDGDGLVDFVDFRGTGTYQIYHSAGGAWKGNGGGVIANEAGGKPDLLVGMENGLGGTTTLEYRPSTQWDNTGGDGVVDLPFNVWTVTRIERDDGMCDTAGVNCTGVDDSGHVLTTVIRYEDGRYDPVDREFRGFFLVWSEDDNPEAPNHLARATWFHQGAALKGKVLKTGEYAADGGSPPVNPTEKLLTSTVNVWQCADPISGSALANCPEHPAGDVWVRLAASYRYAYSNYDPDAWRAVVTSNAGWHQCNGTFYGNVAHSYTGDMLDSGAWVHTHTEYSCLDTPAAYIVDKPTRVWVKDEGGARILEEKWFVYDGGSLTNGNVTSVYSWLDGVVDDNLPVGTSCPLPPNAGFGTCVTAEMVYDDFGNVTDVLDANQNITTTIYDAAKIYPETTTNARRHKVTSGYDPACGKLLWKTIPYKGNDVPAERSRREYDTFCRLEKTALPGDNIDTNPHQQFVYYLGKQHIPTVIVTYTREPHHFAGSIMTSTLSDALGRVIQEKHESSVDGSYAIVAGATRVFGARGSVAQLYAPFSHAGLLNDYTEPPADIGVSLYEHDALGRITRVVNPDGTQRSVEHDVAWHTTTKNGCYQSAGCTGGKIVEKRDAFGRVAEKEVYEQDTLETRTRFTHDGLGRRRGFEQGNATSWNPNTRITVDYDSLGRKRQMDDPDSGTWKYGYDLVGNLVYQDDPKAGQEIEFCYDELNRVTKKSYLPNDRYFEVSCDGNVPQQNSYSYVEEGMGLGKLHWVQDDKPDTSRVLTTFGGYDVRGRARSVTKEVYLAGIDSPGMAKTATLQYEFDDANHVTQITYPGGETVVYSYDLAGQPVSMQNTATPPISYVESARYDVFGRLRRLDRGNATTDRWEYHGKQENFRLSQILTTGPSGTLQDLNYDGYQQDGLLTHISDRRTGSECTAGVLCNTVTYTYDGLGRLIGALGPNVPHAPGPSGYAHDALGNLTNQGGKNLSYDDPQRPHTLTKINGSSSELGHDANGNRGGKPGHGYSYDGDDRLSRLVVNGTTVDFVYDYAGTRIARIERGEGGAVTTVRRYFNELVEATPNGMMKWYFLGGQRIASKNDYAPGFASLEKDPATQVASVLDSQPLPSVLLREDIRLPVALAVVLLGTGLALVPWRQRRVLGIAVRHGHVIGVAVAFLIGTWPRPLAIEPAWAGGGGGGGATCGGAGDWFQLRHYHANHLGSTEVVTYRDGKVISYIRYQPYGEIRGRYNCNQVAFSTPDYNSRYEFTSYETEPVSGLNYAGARFYDPALGMFLTHDPAREFPSPYTYVHWDPVNGTDPNGECELLCVAIIVLAASSVASAIDAGVKTGDVGAAFKAGAISLASTAAGPLRPGLQAVAPKEFGGFDAGDWAILQIPVAGSVYGAVRSFENGNYATGVVGVAATVYQAFGVYHGGDWSTPGQAATSVAKAATTPFIGEDFGAAWRSAFADTLSGNWKAASTGGYMPASWADALAAVQYPDDAAANGMHAWHAGSNAVFAGSLGIAGAPLIIVAGVLHESPLDWVSFQAEQYWQGSVNHFLDSSSDIATNVFGMVVGYSKLSAARGVLSARAAEWGNFIPGPGEPDPAFGGGGPYRGYPSHAWGQYP